MDRIASGIEQMQMSPDGGLDFARSIMTTDTRAKHVAVKTANWSIGGVVKGVGMIHPNMATMLCFITTDAAVAQPFLASVLKEAVDDSFNMIDIDNDTSPDDTVTVLANGLAGGEPIDAGHPEADLFRTALRTVCISLAKQQIADAEGATKMIEARVEGAASLEDARNAAREIVVSVGVKTAIYGHDPNWGRIISAVGNSGAAMKTENTTLYLTTLDGGELCLFRDGVPQQYDPAEAKACLAPHDVSMRVDHGPRRRLRHRLGLRPDRRLRAPEQPVHDMSEIIVAKIGGSTLGSHDTALADVSRASAPWRAPGRRPRRRRAHQRLAARHNVPTRFERRPTCYGRRFAGGRRRCPRRTREQADRRVHLGSRRTPNRPLRRRRRYSSRPHARRKARFRRRNHQRRCVPRALAVWRTDVIPVIAPIALEWEGERPVAQLLNINADTAAGAIAAALEARWLVLLTDVPGVRSASGDVDFAARSN